MRSLKEPGRYGDGLGLWLQVSPVGTKSWLFRYMVDGKARMMGLGRYPDVTLEIARQEAAEWRKLKQGGKDPILERDTNREAMRAAERLARQRTMTFDECAKAYIAANRAGWKNYKHSTQWENTIETYASPIIGSLPVASIDTGLVLKVLEKIWTAKPETASRLRGRIEAVLGWATVRGYRSGENPAAWRNHLDKVLPARSTVAKIAHHPALPYRELGAFVKDLRAQAGIASLALEFAILTASRSNEVIGATWGEFDLREKVWIIPGERMKAKKEHWVPLSKRALAILASAQALRENPEDLASPVFVSPRGGSLSNMAMLAVLKRMGRTDLTTHGFRSTFRDWAGETTAYPREVIEHALAHQLKDKAEAAYARGTLLDKRRRLMADWQKFCDTVPETQDGDVIEIRRNA